MATFPHGRPSFCTGLRRTGRTAKIKRFRDQVETELSWMPTHALQRISQCRSILRSTNARIATHVRRGVCGSRGPAISSLSSPSILTLAACT
ncbi:hypothetical protein B0H10DRAFT_1975971 [Mycena sp. CBHHK59/15]|nr:hypothetical protein B0H10DRAFT_1975971 [Mycena sp. CBHHK59/15]